MYNYRYFFTFATYYLFKEIEKNFNTNQIFIYEKNSFISSRLSYVIQLDCYRPEAGFSD